MSDIESNRQMERREENDWAKLIKFQVICIVWAYKFLVVTIIVTTLWSIDKNLEKLLLKMN